MIDSLFMNAINIVNYLIDHQLDDGKLAYKSLYGEHFLFLLLNNLSDIHETYKEKYKSNLSDLNYYIKQFSDDYNNIACDEFENKYGYSKYNYDQNKLKYTIALSNIEENKINEYLIKSYNTNEHSTSQLFKINAQYHLQEPVDVKMLSTILINQFNSGCLPELIRMVPSMDSHLINTVLLSQFMEHIKTPIIPGISGRITLNDKLMNALSYIFKNIRNDGQMHYMLLGQVTGIYSLIVGQSSSNLKNALNYLNSHKNSYDIFPPSFSSSLKNLEYEDIIEQDNEYTFKYDPISDLTMSAYFMLQAWLLNKKMENNDVTKNISI